MNRNSIRLAATGARVAIGAVVAAACVAGVVAASAAPLPRIENQPASVSVNPVPGDTVLVCGGSFRALGRDASQAGLMVSAGVPALQIAHAGAEAPASAPLEMPGLAGGSGAQTLTGAVHDRTAPLIAASESLTLAEEDLSGFAAAPCREPSMRSWLVGGDASTGFSDIIVLSNPGDVPATVQLGVYGDKRSTSTTVVPAKTQVGVPLASIASGEQRPVIDVASTGAPVRSVLQSGLVRTLDPIGIDLQDGAGGPQGDVLLLGVQSSSVADGDDATSMVVRMLAPADDAQATLLVRANGSTAVIDQYEIDLAAGAPGEIALSGLPAGAYDIEIQSTEPIVAAARQTLRSGREEDFAWMLPAPELAADAPLMFSVPDGPQATLHLHNPGEEAVTVSLDDTASEPIDIAAESSAAIRVTAGSHVLTATGPVHAAIGMQSEDAAAIAGWPLWPTAATQQPILVHP